LISIEDKQMSVFSDVKVMPVTGGKILARGSVVVGGACRVNFSVLNGANGKFVMLPSEKSDKVDEVTGKPKYFPHAQLISRELSDELTRLVLKTLDGGETAEPTTPRAPAAKKAPVPF
jgi:DNA-binding cell septation regulator SpoVG